jgi:LruC domain-containing protein
MKKTKTLQKFSFTACVALCMLLFTGCMEDELVSPSNIIDAENSSANTMIAVEPCMEVDLITGKNNTKVGTIGVAVASNGDLLVTYKITQHSTYLSGTNLDLFSDIEQFSKDKKCGRAGANPERFVFREDWSSKQKVTSYTARIPQIYVDLKRKGKNCFSIATKVELTNGESAWGGKCDRKSKSKSFYSSKRFSSNDGSAYFDFCLDNCNSPIDFTYAWEDMKYGQNDGDYNDFVVQADVVRSANALDLTFLATARGAHYEHQFKIRVPKKGIVGGIAGIVGAKAVVEDSTYYIITVINGTKSVLPPDVQGFANTQKDSPCMPFYMTKIQLRTDRNFSYDPTKPYIPFISVFQDGVIGVDENPDYDLSIYELTQNVNDTYSLNGEKFPNGIIIPRDWKWPLEHTFVAEAYPDFNSLTEGWNADWAENLVDATKTFDASDCNRSLISTLRLASN